MLQLDNKSYACTCFIFMKPTSNMKRLLTKWMKSIVEMEANDDQASQCSAALYSICD